MTKWSYLQGDTDIPVSGQEMMVYVFHNNNYLGLTSLNTLGDDGWNLIEVIPINEIRLRLIFRRPLN